MAEAADALRKSWLAALAHERRASPHTLRAYGDDVARFLGFQVGHTGGALTQKALAKLTPADIRAPLVRLSPHPTVDGPKTPPIGQVLGPSTERAHETFASGARHGIDR